MRITLCSSRIFIPLAVYYRYIYTYCYHGIRAVRSAPRTAQQFRTVDFWKELRWVAVPKTPGRCRRRRGKSSTFTTTAAASSDYNNNITINVSYYVLLLLFYYSFCRTLFSHVLSATGSLWVTYYDIIVLTRREHDAHNVFRMLSFIMRSLIIIL